jgi:hypothetical protein
MYVYVVADLDLLGDDSRLPGGEFLESPMSDGTIEEDFEEALAKEIEAGNGSLRSPGEAELPDTSTSFVTKIVQWLFKKDFSSKPLLEPFF